MSDSIPIPENVRRFLSERIHSVAQLEALLLLRDAPERQWSAAELGKALYASPDTIAQQLDHLYQGQLLAASNGAETLYRYRPATPELDVLVRELEAIYKQRRVAVITAMYS